MAKSNVKIQISVPVQGSLGVLALGAVGLKIWRKKRAEGQGSKKEAPEDEC